MPELPEVESIRQHLCTRLIGRRITAVAINRADVIHGKATKNSLLLNKKIAAIDRLGKQLAIRSLGHHQNHDGPCLCIHLGMSGSLAIKKTPQSVSKPPANVRRDRHLHVVWTLNQSFSLMFRDPRRFGGIWVYKSYSDLRDQRWSKLGVDALAITPAELIQKLTGTKRSIKACLLDQAILAGMGNIYVDEVLHLCGVHPLTPATHIDIRTIQKLVRILRKTLHHSIDRGGSSIKDHRDPQGNLGSYQKAHQVYGRAGKPCMQCNQTLIKTCIAGRTTVYCEQCQPIDRELLLNEYLK